LVDLNSSSLNLLRDLVRQLMPLYSAILDPVNNLEGHAENRVSVRPNESTEFPPVGAGPQDALSRSLLQETDNHADQSGTGINLPPLVAREDRDLSNSTGAAGARCVSAALLAQYDRQALFESVWRANLRTVAAEIGIYHKTLGRVCRELYIPLPPHGFWKMRSEARAAVPRPLLPEVRVGGGGVIKSEISDKPLTVSALLFSRYDREELYRKAWQKPLQELAKEYGVSRDLIAFHCRQLYIPIPGALYWQREARLEEKDWPPLPPVVAVGFTNNTKRKKFQ